MLTADNVSFEYETEDHENKLQIRDLSLTVERGELIAILGRSGIGKSTLLRLLAGLRTPLAGTVACDGTPVQQPMSPIALVVQEYKWAVFPWKTARENIELGRFKPSHARNTRDLDEILKLLDLQDRRDAFPSKLSGGQAQRVQLGRALYTGADFLLFDEPTSSLDNELTCNFYTLVRKLAAENNIGSVIVTHDIDESCFYADRLCVLRTSKADAGFSLVMRDGFGARTRSLADALMKPEFTEIVQWAHTHLFQN